MTFVSPFTGDVIQPTDVSYAEYNLTATLQLQWPSNSNGVPDPAARIMDVTTSSAAYHLIMPDATQTSVGTDALINNLGATSVNVYAYGDINPITTVTAGKSKYLYLTNNNSTSGDWGIIDFGAATGSADASVLAGLGLVAITNTLNQSHPTSNLPNGYTFLAADRAQTKIWSGGSGTVTLPLAASLGNNWFTIIKNNGVGSFTLQGTSGEDVDGNLTKTFLPNDSAFVICDGTQFVTIGYGQSTQFFFTALVYPVVGGTYNLTTSEVQSVIQEIVGTLSSNVELVYPPIVNLYVVSNQTVDNGFTLTLTTGVSGGTNAVIPPGQQATLVCDGVNFFNANTVQAGATSLNLINGTVTTPAINFAAETNTGIWRGGVGEFDISILGVNRFALTSAGLAIDGEGRFLGGVGGGNFT